MLTIEKSDTLKSSPKKSIKAVLHHVLDDGALVAPATTLAPPRPRGSTIPRSKPAPRSSKTHSVYTGGSARSSSVGTSRGSRSSGRSTGSNPRRKAGAGRKKEQPFQNLRGDFKENPKFKGKLISSYRMPQFFQRTAD